MFTFCSATTAIAVINPYFLCSSCIKSLMDAPLNFSPELHDFCIRINLIRMDIHRPTAKHCPSIVRKQKIASFLRILPRKLRVRLYRCVDMVRGRDDGKLPSVLQALEPGDSLYHEAKAVYIEGNVNVHLYPAGIEHFAWKDPAELLPCRHLTLIWTDWEWKEEWESWHDLAVRRKFVDLQLQVSCCKNLEMISLKIKTIPSWWYTDIHFEMIRMLRMLLGDCFSVKKVIVRVQDWDYTKSEHDDEGDELSRSEWSPSLSSYSTVDHDADEFVTYTCCWEGKRLAEVQPGAEKD